MKSLPREATDELFNKYWNEMRREWFKLEVRQDYSGEDIGPSLDSWLKSDKQRSVTLLEAEDNREWIKSCQEKLAQGIKLVRIHIIEKPLSPYMEWELMHYEHINIPKCGEKVYLVDKSATAGWNIPAGDLMIFDNQRAVVNAYDQNGLMVRETFYDQNDDLSEYLELAKKLKKIARPLTKTGAF